ncbi:hypothetical protein HNR19_000507 [Nocardioides thalensis]|uniref:Uncharacterized protein n=1 Tax=Nocardioides thalensis TaxID=1914755 RepID=A0A853BX78_9ACTN|nr:hypothetical protein [Nocardioides thalensis]NYI99808.1 hypothetical protein [Nocardioides thalensis]
MTRRHRHLDGTEHAAGQPGPTLVRVPRLPRQGLVDTRLLVVALAVSSPAIYRLAQGMVSMTEVLTRYLLVALGCVATGALVRWVWPLLSGDRPDPVDPLRDAIAAGLAAPPADRDRLDGMAGDLDATAPLDLDAGFDPLPDDALTGGFDDGAATALLGLDAADDLLELSDSRPA